MSMSAGAADSTPAKFNLGTGWGTAEADRVSLVGFQRDTELGTLSLYYSDAEGLRAAGIVLEKTVSVATAATPLPKGFGGFCQPPKSVR
jgi:hypothetical protein